MDIGNVAQYGIAVVLIVYMGWRDRMLDSTIKDHFRHSEEAFYKMMTIIDKNTTALTRFNSSKK